MVRYTGDGDPLQERPRITTAEWNGSAVIINDARAILQAARKEATCIFYEENLTRGVQEVEVDVQTYLTANADEGLRQTALIHLRNSENLSDPAQTKPLDTGWFLRTIASQNLADGTIWSEESGAANARPVNDPYTIGVSFDHYPDTYGISFNARAQCITITNCDTPPAPVNTDRSIEPAFLGTPQTLLQERAVAGQLVNIMKVVISVIDLIHMDSPQATQAPTALQREYCLQLEPAPNNTPQETLGQAALSAASRPDSNDQEMDSDTPKPAALEPPDVELVSSSTYDLALNDIGGLDAIKDELRDVAMAFRYPEAMRRWATRPPRGILLHGEPGVGKTTLARALANEIDADLREVKSSDIYGMWLGESETHIRKIFQEACASEEPVVLLFDEIDTIFPNSKGPRDGVSSTYDSVAGLFRTAMDELPSHVLVIATTNRPDDIDPSIRRSGRFDLNLYVPLPDAPARQAIIAHIITDSITYSQKDADGHIMLNADDLDVLDEIETAPDLDDGGEAESGELFAKDLDTGRIAAITDGLTGADLKNIFDTLCRGRAMQEARTQLIQPPITQAEIERAVRRFKIGEL